VTLRAALAIIWILAIAPACGGDSTAGTPNTLRVFAASSLIDAFEDLGAEFESRSDRIEVSFVFGSSSDLVTQLEQGARADVFASADEANMDRAVEAGLVDGDPQLFALNELEIIVPPDNPAGIEALSDLTDEDLVVAICTPECPAGRYALQVFDNAGIAVTPDSFESEVRGVVTRVALGEADAGIAYVSDTTAAGGDVVGIPIPDDVGVVAEYPTVALSDDGAADRWIDFVLSAVGQEVLNRYGFHSP